MEEKSIHNTCRRNSRTRYHAPFLYGLTKTACRPTNMDVSHPTGPLCPVVSLLSNGLQREQNWPVSSNFIRRSILPLLLLFLFPPSASFLFKSSLRLVRKLPSSAVTRVSLCAYYSYTSASELILLFLSWTHNLNRCADIYLVHAVWMLYY